MDLHEILFTAGVSLFCLAIGIMIGYFFIGRK